MSWPETVGTIEIWWILIAAIGVVLASIDVDSARREVGLYWRSTGVPERMVSLTGFSKAVLLYLGSFLNLLVGVTSALTPEARTQAGEVYTTTVAAGLILVELVLVGVTVLRNVESWYIHWFAAEKDRAEREAAEAKAQREDARRET